jgi:hypothetical protein
MLSLRKFQQFFVLEHGEDVGTTATEKLAPVTIVVDPTSRT